MYNFGGCQVAMMLVYLHVDLTVVDEFYNFSEHLAVLECWNLVHNVINNR